VRNYFPKRNSFYNELLIAPKNKKTIPDQNSDIVLKSLLKAVLMVMVVPVMVPMMVRINNNARCEAHNYQHKKGCSL